MKSGLFKIYCPHCKKESLENNAKFDPSVKPNGTMFRQIKGVKVRSMHDALKGVKGQNFQCPMCMMPLCTPGGWLKLKDPEGNIILSKDAQDILDYRKGPVGTPPRFKGLGG